MTMASSAIYDLDLLSAVEQMAPEEFDAFIEQALARRGRPPATRLSKKETELLQRINRGLPAATSAHYAKLAQAGQTHVDCRGTRGTPATDARNGKSRRRAGPSRVGARPVARRIRPTVDEAARNQDTARGCLVDDSYGATSLSGVLTADVSIVGVPRHLHIRAFRLSISDHEAGRAGNHSRISRCPARDATITNTIARALAIRPPTRQRRCFIRGGMFGLTTSPGRMMPRK